jgi:hypothetical protein
MGGEVANPPEGPSRDAMRDLQTAIENVLLGPDDGLESILVLAVAHGSDGKVKSRIILAPSDRQERLLDMLRDYLAIPTPERTAAAAL